MFIAYIILHYMATKDTIECVDSILESSGGSIHNSKIIIVDNNSPNDSLEVLAKYYCNEKRVSIIHNEENLGFAKGNNVGFRLAKEKYNADFIVQLNNDTLVKQSDFESYIVKIYEEFHYGVLGPDIVTLDGCHQNPGKEVNWSYSKLIKFRIKKRIQYLLSYFPLMDNFLKVNEGAFLHEKVNESVLNTQLHGACFIFSPEYIKRFDGMYDKTFLYMEEDILKLRAKYLGYMMMYSPFITIIHKEDVATNMLSEKSIEKKHRIYKNLLESSKQYLYLLRRYRKGIMDD